MSAANAAGKRRNCKDHKEGKCRYWACLGWAAQPRHLPPYFTPSIYDMA